MQVDIGSLVEDPSYSYDTRVEVNFIDLIKKIFENSEDYDRKLTTTENMSFL